MTLKEELEILRGAPIEVFDGDPKDIPCIETSDPEKLCRHPVVSVQMITYNHEPYIRQAIEGVMMQKTDFEFELIIGEDCSQDRTREICFEYQKKHPDKIRVLWWYENVSKQGGNGRRCRAWCRGEFIALCEGDDYWTDPLKLQKQVDLIRRTDSVMCVAFTDWSYSDGHVVKSIYEAKEYVTARDFDLHYFHTSTFLFRRDTCEFVVRHFPFLFWYDTILFYAIESQGKVALLPEVVSVYRLTGRGTASSLSQQKRNEFSLLQMVELFEITPRPEVRGLFARSLCGRIAHLFENKGEFSPEFSKRCYRLLVQLYLRARVYLIAKEVRVALARDLRMMRKIISFKMAS